MKKRLDPTAGARRELRLALSRVRAAITHSRYADTVNYLPAKLRARVAQNRRDLYAVEESLCSELGALAIDNSGQPTLGKAP